MAEDRSDLLALDIENSNVGYLGVRGVHNCNDLSIALVIDPTQMSFRAMLIVGVPICFPPYLLKSQVSLLLDPSKGK